MNNKINSAETLVYSKKCHLAKNKMVQCTKSMLFPQLSKLYALNPMFLCVKDAGLDTGLYASS